MTKKVWIFNHYAYTPENGNITRTYDLVGGLIKEGYDVTIFTSSSLHNMGGNEITDKRTYLEKNIDGRHYVYVRTRDYTGNGVSRILNIWDFYKGLKRVTKQFEKPDVIYASSPHIFTLKAAMVIAAKLKIPFISEVRDLWPEAIVQYSNFSPCNPVIQYLYALEKKIYIRSAAVIFLKEGGYEYIVDKKWDKLIPAGKVHYINNGVDLDIFDQMVAIKEIDDPDLNDTDTFKIVYTGAMRLVNGMHMVIDSARFLKDKGYGHLKFLLYGAGGDVDTLSSKVKELGLDNVVFKGFVNKRDIPYILTKSDANLLHNKHVPLERYGTSQNKLFEYLASGRPVIATTPMGHSIVKKYNAGLEVEYQTIEEMVRVISEMYDATDEQRAQYGKNARAAASHYDMEKLSKALSDVIDKVIDDG